MLRKLMYIKTGGLVRGPLQAINFFFLVLQELAVELLSDLIDGGIHILVFDGGCKISTTYMEIGFDFLSLLFHAESDLNAGYPIIVSCELAEFFGNVITQSFCDVDMMATDINLHAFLS